jgi:threonylcarbamoyladenosine tRNA methylthiotransferase MtaB
LGERQSGRQRAFLKVQDGCDAHCTYCIIPKLRPRLWSKPVEVAVEEATRLAAAGHVELVLTGIFLGAYGQPTALCRRQPRGGGDGKPIAELVAALCTRVPGLRRLRLSSLEPGDLTPELIAVLRDHAQVVPHFHLPLQSGSGALLRRMNRQYTRDDFLRMTDRVRAAFDRPALTTDVIVGFPGETDAEFERTVEVVNQAGFIHVHAFGFSPRPGTAAARWRRDFVHGTFVHERIERLRGLAREHDYRFRRQFLGEMVELLIEREGERDDAPADAPGAASADAPPPGGPTVPGHATRHGRCERYFSVSVDGTGLRAGDFVRARVARVEPAGTIGETLGEVLR